jgi:hypothetical protein
MLIITPRVIALRYRRPQPIKLITALLTQRLSKRDPHRLRRILGLHTRSRNNRFERYRHEDIRTSPGAMNVPLTLAFAMLPERGLVWTVLRAIGGIRNALFEVRDRKHDGEEVLL